MDAAEYKHVVLGLIFLKYVSDSYEERRQWLLRETADPKSEYFVKKESQRGYVLEDRDEYTGQNVFWVPMKARWQEVQKAAKKPEIGQLIDDAMDLIEKENPVLKGVLPKNYARPDLDKRRLGELIDLLSNIDVGGQQAREMDVLGRIYEYFIGKFASAEGKSGGEFYTPSCIVRLLVEMIEPYKGRVYDPCCGSGGMFVQSEKFVEAHGGQRHDLTLYGQELNPNTWRLCKMNLAIRALEGNLGPQWGDVFHKDLHPDLKADFILANPPFNISDWGGDKLQDDKRWKYGPPSPGNANFAWIQHIVHHLAPGGIAGFVLANGSMSSNQSGEGEIRKALVEADLVDCMISLPGQLFYSVQIPVCLWFLTRSKSGRAASPSRPVLRDRTGQVLFIDARNLGTMVDRTHKELTAEDIQKIATNYHAWRTDTSRSSHSSHQSYADVPGFCYSASLDEIRTHGHVLTPGRYVGAEKAEDDGEPFENKMKRFTAKLQEQFTESARLEKTIQANLKDMGYAG